MINKIAETIMSILLILSNEFWLCCGFNVTQ
jgi:hypothetical protein